MSASLEVSRARCARERPYESVFKELLGAFEDSPLGFDFRRDAPLKQGRYPEHSLHPYPGRLLPQIAQFILGSGFVHDNDAILDPFCGSGTVLVEAQRGGFESVGFELNPIAANASSAKLLQLDKARAVAFADKIAERASMMRPEEVRRPKMLIRWYEPQHFDSLARLSSALIAEDESDLAPFLAIVFSLTAREFSQTDPRISVPVRPYVAREISGEPIERFCTKARHVAERMRSESPATLIPKAEVINADSRDALLWGQLVERDTVVVTSPPYGAAQKYLRSTSLESTWLAMTPPDGIQALEHHSVGREKILSSATNPDLGGLPLPVRNLLNELGSISTVRRDIYAHYFIDMQRIIANLASRTQIGRAAFVLGTNVVAGRKVETHRYIDCLMNEAGFTHQLVLEDRIRGRSLLTARRSAPAEAEFVYFYERTNG